MAISQVLPIALLTGKQAVVQSATALLGGTGQQLFSRFHATYAFALPGQVGYAVAWVRGVDDEKPLFRGFASVGQLTHGVEDKKLAEGIASGHVGLGRVV